MKTAIVTDTSCISVEEGKQMGIFVIPMPFMIDGEEFQEGVNLDKDYFYEKLQSDAEISTSQPAAGLIMDTWDEVLKDYDELVFIPLSSGLSGTYANACIYAKDYEGKVEVVDLQRVSVPMKVGVLDAAALAQKGYTARQIREIMDKEKSNSTVFIMVESLDRLKKGGRITPMAAAIGSMLKIKPVLQLKGEKLDSYAKVRSLNKAKHIMFDAVRKEIEVMGIRGPEDARILGACSYGYEESAQWVEEIKAEFPGYEVSYDDLPMNLSCHTGVGAVGIAVTKRLEVLK